MVIAARTRVGTRCDVQAWRDGCSSMHGEAVGGPSDLGRRVATEHGRESPAEVDARPLEVVRIGGVDGRRGLAQADHAQ
jgi:hypothetical protein